MEGMHAVESTEGGCHDGCIGKASKNESGDRISEPCDLPASRLTSGT